MKQVFLFGVFIVGTIALVVCGAYFFLQSPATTPSQVSSPTSTPSFPEQKEEFVREVPQGFKEYRSDPHHFSLLYPADLTIARRDGMGNTTTFTFQNTETGQGFQIYILPYQEAQVSEAQFKKDIPSGVRNDLTNITIDGAVGAAFYSTDANLGETREVWFVRQGWLYEVTGLKPLDTWLEQILKTWLFLN